MKLRSGENLVYKTRSHWMVFAWAVWPAPLAGRLFTASNYATNTADAQMWFNLAWSFSVLAGIVVILAQFYRWISRFIPTDRRVSLENGILRQRSTEFPLRNIESVLVEFSILGRLFNYGTVTVRGFGGSRNSIKRVPKPERVRELIEENNVMAPRLYATRR